MIYIHSLQRGHVISKWNCQGMQLKRQGLFQYFQGPHLISSNPRAVNFYFAPCRGMKYCNQRISITVCVFACLRISQNQCPNFTKFSEHFTCGRGSVLLWQQCNTGFVDNIAFSYDGLLYARELYMYITGRDTAAAAAATYHCSGSVVYT